MKKILFTLLMLVFVTPAFCQEEEQTQTQDKPVKNTFGTSILVENQTVMTPFQGNIEFEIHHRFSTINDIHDLFGLYGSANTRLGLNYGITDKIMVGIGITKDNKPLDVQWKYTFLQQTKSNSMPVSIAYYGNLGIDLRDSSLAAPRSGEKFKQIHRLSYLHELIIARKFGDKLSLQIAPSFFYFNTVQKGYKNANFAISAGGRYKVVESHSIIFEYDQLLTKQDSIVVDSKYSTKKPNPNVTIGWEIGTGTHTFQVFATNYQQILYQRNLLYNTNDFKKRKYMFGFNITVRF